MYLYLYHNDSGSEEIHQTPAERVTFREKLLRSALKDYSMRIRSPLTDEMIRDTGIQREPKGKPYFADVLMKDGKPLTEVHFSISHSGDWWGCLMAKEPVGFDLEICRDSVNYEKLAKRFFTEEEHEWISKMGIEAFFEVWVRKEAFVKYLGFGLSERLSSFTVIQEGQFSVRVAAPKNGELRRAPDFILPCNIAEGVKAAYCCRSGAPIMGTIMLEVSNTERQKNER